MAVAFFSFDYIETDGYLLVKRNLHIKFVLRVGAVKNYVTAA